jgi:hypothetical protein
MTQWMVREGAAGGRYLWEAKAWLSNWTLGTAGGGDWRSVPEPLVAWWEEGQRGAARYKTRDEAYRVAKRVNGRVVKLHPRTTSAQGRKDDAG